MSQYAKLRSHAVNLIDNMQVKRYFTNMLAGGLIGVNLAYAISNDKSLLHYVGAIFIPIPYATYNLYMNKEYVKEYLIKN